MIARIPLLTFVSACFPPAVPTKMSAARSPAENWQIFVQACSLQRAVRRAFVLTICIYQSIKGVLLKWAAWRLAIENSWGGPATDAKEDQLWQNIAAYFSSGKEPHWDEVPILNPEYVYYKPLSCRLTRIQQILENSCYTIYSFFDRRAH